MKRGAHRPRCAPTSTRNDGASTSPPGPTIPRPCSIPNTRLACAADGGFPVASAAANRSSSTTVSTRPGESHAPPWTSSTRDVSGEFSRLSAVSIADGNHKNLINR